MPCGQICKEILDGGAAAQRSFHCMSNTLVLGLGEPSPAAHENFMAAADTYAKACAEVVASCGAKGHKPPPLIDA